jgi:hypothetical protein
MNMSIHKHFMQQQHNENKKRHQQGFITIMSVLIVTLVGTAIALWGLAYSTRSAKTDLVVIHSYQTRALLDACVEAALLQIRLNPSYTGASAVTIDEYSCKYHVTLNDDGEKVIDSEGGGNSIIRRLTVVLSDYTSDITIKTWEER